MKINKEFSKEFSFNGRKMKDLSILKDEKYKDIEILYLHKNRVEDFSELKNLPNIKTLVLSNNNLQNLDFLEYLPNLESLNVNGNNISKIDFSNPNLKNLKEFYLSNNHLSTKSIKGISELKNLKILDITGNLITDISSLAGLELQALFIHNSTIFCGNQAENKIENISPLLDMMSLKCVQLKMSQKLEDNHKNFIFDFFDYTVLVWKDKNYFVNRERFGKINSLKKYISNFQSYNFGDLHKYLNS